MTGVSGVEIEFPGGAVVRLPYDASAEVITTAIRAALCNGIAAEDE